MRSAASPAVRASSWAAPRTAPSSVSVAHSLFVAAAVASLSGHPVQEKLTLGGDGGGALDLASNGGAVTLTVTGRIGAGPSAAEVADALAGRPPAAVLGGLPAGARTTRSHLADSFNRPVDQGAA
jgi:hypothetical protein